MIAYLIVVVLNFAVWFLFFSAISMGAPEMLAWALFGLCWAGLLWIVHEGVTLATARLSGE